MNRDEGTRGDTTRSGTRRRSFLLSAVLCSVLVFGLTTGVGAALMPGDARQGSLWHWAMVFASVIRNGALHLGLCGFGLALACAFVRRWICASGFVLLGGLGLWCDARVVWDQISVGRDAIVGDTLTVVTHNVLGRNTEWSALCEQLLGSGAAIVGIQEGVGHWHREIDARLTGEFAWHGPSKEGHLGSKFEGVWLLSRIEPEDEIVAVETPGVDGLVVRGEFAIGGRRVAVYVVHMPHAFFPLHARFARGLFDALVVTLEAERLPVVVMGDFNAGVGSWRYARLRAIGLRSSLELAGRGRGATWPSGSRRVPLMPGFAIDHVFVGGGLTCVRHELLGAEGSDHRAVLAEIGFAAGS